MNQRKLKRYVVAMIRRGANYHEIIKDLPASQTLAVMEYVEKKYGTF